jgi:hypothetical protein
MTNECIKYIKKWLSKQGFTSLNLPYPPTSVYERHSLNKENWKIIFIKNHIRYEIYLYSPNDKEIIKYIFKGLTLQKIMFIFQVISKRINRKNDISIV